MFEDLRPCLERRESGRQQQRGQLVGRAHPLLLHDDRIANVRRSARCVKFLFPNRESGHALVFAPGDDADDTAGTKNATHFRQRGDGIQ